MGLSREKDPKGQSQDNFRETLFLGDYDRSAIWL